MQISENRLRSRIFGIPPPHDFSDGVQNVSWSHQTTIMYVFDSSSILAIFAYAASTIVLWEETFADCSEHRPYNLCCLL